MPRVEQRSQVPFVDRPATRINWGKRLSIISGSTSVVLLAWLIGRAAHRAELNASYDRTCEAYVQQLSDPEPSRRSQGAHNVGVLRVTHAYPQLADLLRTDPDDDVRASAAYGLGWGGEAAHPYIPDLFDALSDPSLRVQRYARSALRDIGDAGEAYVQKELLGDNPARRIAAVTALWCRGGYERSALVALSKHADPRVRVATLQLLGSAAGGRLNARPVVRRCLKDDALEVRWAAMWLAGREYTDARADCPGFKELEIELLPFSLAMAAHEDFSYRRMALNHLTASGDTSEAVVAVVVEALDDPDTVEQALCADWNALGRTAVPPLIELLGRSAQTDRVASGALAVIGWEAIPLLRRALDSELPDAQREAIWAVMKRIADHEDPADAPESAEPAKEDG